MSEQIIPQPNELWRYKHNHKAIYEVDHCNHHNVVHYRIHPVGEFNNKRLLTLELDAWLKQYEKLPVDDLLAKTGIF